VGEEEEEEEGGGGRQAVVVVGGFLRAGCQVNDRMCLPGLRQLGPGGNFSRRRDGDSRGGDRCAVIDDNSAGSWACPNQASHDEVGARARPAKLCPAMRLQDHAARSNEEHGCINLLDEGVDSLGQRRGRSESVGEGLHVLVCVIVSNDASEMLCPAVLRMAILASLVEKQCASLRVLLVVRRVVLLANPPPKLL
jgi:hypothetical protein